MITEMNVVIAPYVVAGSYIVVQIEADYYRWYFDGTNLLEQQGQLVFDNGYVVKYD